MIIVMSSTKVELGKGKKKRRVPRSYVPPSLTKEDRKKQIESLEKGTRRDQNM